MRGEIEHAQEGLQTLEGVDVQVHRTKKLYQQSCDQVTKLYGKLERARADPNTAPKAKQQVGRGREGGRVRGREEGMREGRRV